MNCVFDAGFSRRQLDAEAEGDVLPGRFFATGVEHPHSAPDADVAEPDAVRDLFGLGLNAERVEAGGTRPARVHERHAHRQAGARVELVGEGHVE